MGRVPGGLRLRKDKPAPQPRVLLASALPIEGPAGKQAWRARSGDDGWQKQAWYYYDAVGELRFAFNYLANAVSRASLYAAEIDPDTGLVTGPTEDARAQAAASKILGGADERPQLQSTLSLQWQVSGETFVLILPQGAGLDDRWLVLSATAVREQGGSWSFQDPLTGVWTRLRSGTDRLIRLWSPHPNQQTHADSAMRAANPILTEVEKASQNIIARLDSRLAGNGILFLPQELDFPTADGEKADARSFMRMLLEASEAGIADPGTAAAQVPLMAQIPAELMAAMANAHVDLATEFDAAVSDLREAALTRVGRTLDMPREVAMGQTAEANHWQGWQIEEITYKIHLEPFLLKLGMALTSTYYRPVLRAMGIEDPSRHVLAWDVTEIVKRPDDTEDAKWAWDNLLVSDDYMRSELGIPDDAIPADDELFLRRLAQAVQVAPTLAAQAEIAEKLFGLQVAPAAAGVAAGTPTRQPAITEGGSAPATPPEARALPQPADTAPDPGLVAAAELVAFDALSRAGGRLLTRRYRGQFGSTPKWELHTVIPADGRESELMEGSFQFTDNIASAFSVDAHGLRSEIMAYVRNRLRHGAVHEREILAAHLGSVGTRG